jgi:hypothetical protein
VTFYLQDELPRHPGDPVLLAFLLDPAVFTYAPGVDVHTIFDVSAPFDLDEIRGQLLLLVSGQVPLRRGISVSNK